MYFYCVDERNCEDNSDSILSQLNDPSYSHKLKLSESLIMTSHEIVLYTVCQSKQDSVNRNVSGCATYMTRNIRMVHPSVSFADF